MCHWSIALAMLAATYHSNRCRQNMASLTVKLGKGTAVKGTYLSRREAAYMINPKVYIEVDGVRVGASEKVERTRDPTFDQTVECSNIPKGASMGTSKIRFNIVHANNYGGEEMTVGYVAVPIHACKGDGMEELKLLSEENNEEHGGTLTAHWVFKEAPPSPEEPPAPAAASPAPTKSSDVDAKEALLREMEEQEKKEAIRRAEVDQLNKQREELLAKLRGPPTPSSPLSPVQVAAPAAPEPAPTPAPSAAPIPQAVVPQQPQEPPQQPSVHSPLQAQRPLLPMQTPAQNIPQPQQVLQQPVAGMPQEVQQPIQQQAASAQPQPSPAPAQPTQPVAQPVQQSVAQPQSPKPQQPVQQPVQAAAPNAVQAKPTIDTKVSPTEVSSPQAAKPPRSPAPGAAKGPAPQAQTVVQAEEIEKTSDPEVDKKIVELMKKKQEAVKDERYIDAQKIKDEIDALRKATKEKKKKEETAITTGSKIIVTRRLDLASGRVVAAGDVGEVVAAPGKPAVVQFKESDVCFAADVDDVEPIQLPAAAVIPGLPSSVAKEAAQRQAIADAPVQKEFIQGGAVRAKRLIQFENGKSVEKGALGYAIKVPGSLAVVKVHGAVFSVDEGDVELYKEPERRVTISETPVRATVGDVSIPWVEVPQHISLTSGTEYRHAEPPHVPYDDSFGGVHVTSVPVPPGQYSVVISPTDGVDIVIRNIHPQDTVSKLKRCIQKANNIAPSQQCLSQELVNGSMCVLDDRRSLASYDVRSGDRLMLTIPTGVVPVTFRLPNGKLCKLSGVRLEDTVLAVKRKIHDIANIPITRQRLVLASTGDELVDRKTLSACRVGAGSEVFIEEKDAKRSGSVRVGALRLCVVDEIGDKDSRTYGRSLPLHCSADDTVMSAKRFLGGRLGIAPQALELRHHGVPLRDMQRMRDVLQGSTAGLSIGYKTAPHMHSELHQQAASLRATASALQTRNAALNTSISTIRDRAYAAFSPDPYGKHTSPRRHAY
eukprot:TRINITY_DN21231_c1_g1_i1.p1 TRINITY_DN21231_c1_g1~~TRINITY_DN21231_c1_g1_i1.p1  ORF type:complete len:994 (+),score=272.07 TRINITY_DN21231_c1_g1_i1:692-3673(+)